ncbi:DUF3048 domain-containing protein [Streptomyces alkaliterrae]|uniref:DUF3048 domain-containing protein n=1 Tax=Streptomyces alkaliterrae TaxID=2213162 RepID=A0A5P0YWB4_9ACTN|nr:DUF3048 domain-containing protein [Streptomyces alkaliterrae]MBB1256156.1 DUF3048 domain-containing protein [Streptomyces alkaliterrae]MBB1261749.1 DUF3048 domain-containing protein [Streptomyces alkaliterrae]MQS04574.1 DUF3048 domain-containing protein [Streptomyces alkaliterrae]
MASDTVQSPTVSSRRNRPARRGRRSAALLVGTLLGPLLVGSLSLGAVAAPADREAREAAPGAPGAPAVPPTASPYTGLAATPGPVLAIKVDNSVRARPHTGLAEADLVYVEKVEAGMSRLMAVYASRRPPVVGPVRSARESDLELLKQFGRPALAYSGVQKKLQPHIDRDTVFAVPQERHRGPYFRDQSRRAPHNLYVRPDDVLPYAPHASHSADIGLRFGPVPPGGFPRREAAVQYRAARTSFTWSPREGRWLAFFDDRPAMGTDGRQLGASTVVIQYVTMRPSDFSDSAGHVTPFIETVGSGRALVLRDGRGYVTRWDRPRPGAGTTFTRLGGRPMLFARGQVWIVYADR